MAKVSRNGKAKAAKPETAAVAAKGAGDDLGQTGIVAAIAGGIDGDGAGGAGAVAEVIPAGAIEATASTGEPPIAAGATTPAATSNSTDTPPSEDRLGEAGNAAGLAVGNIMFKAFEDALAKWPRFFAASEAWKAAHPDALPSIVRISAKIEGFRRAGIAHTKAPVDHAIFDFDADRLEQLLGEPHLVVEFA